MNVDLLQTVRNAIADETNPTGFNMRRVFVGSNPFAELKEHQIKREYGSCGTVACIAGHTLGMSRIEDLYEKGVLRMAEEALGLDTLEGTHLFLGHWSKAWELLRDADHFGRNDSMAYLNHITREETVEYLDRCILAGKILTN